MKRMIYLLEIPAFYFFLFWINTNFFADTPAFLDVNPHPYWLGILVFSLYYGLFAGVLAGMVSACLSLVMVAASDQGYLLEDGGFYLLPVCFMAGGLLLGYMTERYQGLQAKLRQEKQLALKQQGFLKEEIQMLGDINRELERRIVTKMATMVTLCEGARKLESEEGGELYRAVLEFMAKTLEFEKAAVYLKVEDGWQVVETYGWQPDHPWPLRLGFSEGLTGMAGSRNKILSVRDFTGSAGDGVSEAFRVGDGVLAGPLRCGENGEAVGVVSIQKMPFFHFNAVNVTLFSFLLDWAGRSIGRAAYIENLRSGEIVDPRLKIYTYHYFKSRAEQEFLRSKTYYVPFVITLLRINGLEGLPKGKKEALMAAVSQILKSCCRNVDIVSLFNEPGIPFAMLLINITDAESLAVKERIFRHFQRLALDLPVSLSLGTSGFSRSMKEWINMVEVAKQELMRETKRAS